MASLYFFLLEKCRQNDGKDFTISDNAICQKLSLTRPTINALKSKLRNVGLIQYQTRNGVPSIYRIITDISFLLQESLQKETLNIKNINIPSLDEFMNFAKSLEIYDETMDFAIKSKYESWRDNGWVNGLGIPINKWQNNLKNTLPHLKTSKKKPSGLQPNNIPTIKRPNQTYNE